MLILQGCWQLHTAPCVSLPIRSKRFSANRFQTVLEMREKREREREREEKASLDDDDEILETDSFIHDLWFPPPPPPGILEARICTGIGLPVPEPPQLLHRIMPVPLHVPQPTSLSDHFVHRHGTLLEPLQVEHRNPPAIGGFSSSASIIDLMAHAPASTPNPCATCIATPGDMFASCLYIALCSKQRNLRAAPPPAAAVRRPPPIRFNPCF
jgi:hypothetical protein